MSTRNMLRRKVVLALHVIRRESGEKQLAHTLDITEKSARLGGLKLVLEPGEVIEIRRGAVKARFEVAWMGAPGSLLEGQAGIRSLEPGKSVWGVDLPRDTSDASVDISLRDPQPPVRTAAPKPAGKRAHERYPCTGSASIKSQGSAYALHGEVKDISEGGAYVELTAPMPVNTQVTLVVNIDGIWIEFAGTVRTSYPLVGMGIQFHKLTPANREKLKLLLAKLRQQACGDNSDFIVEFGRVTNTGSEFRQPMQQSGPDTYPLKVLALACRKLATSFDASRSMHSAAELEELRAALGDLQQKLEPTRPVEQLVDFIAASFPSGSA